MKSPFLYSVTAKRLLVINGLLALFYFFALIFMFQRGDMVLFIALMIGELFHVWQLTTLIHASWNTNDTFLFAKDFEAPIDVYITVAGEPISIVRQTVIAATKINYPNFHVYILNDGRVAKKNNWRRIEKLAHTIDPDKVDCITRSSPGGAKAGNINNALSLTNAPFIAILDCDHIPHEDFLQKMVGYMIDPNVAFVQSPQYYRNHPNNYVANASWQQQTLFFGPICRGKAHSNSLFMCGTNMIIRRSALESVGGMNQHSITEDLLTSLLIHTQGWKSIYVPLILAEGLAPEDLGSYWKQQFRWARGSLEVLWKYNPLWIKGLNWQQRFQYLASVTYYLTGLIVLIDAILPLLFFYSGLMPISSTTMALALVFIPYIFFTLYSLQRISSYTFSFRAMAFSIASWPIYLLALIYTIFRINSSFKITNKKRQDGNYFGLVLIHLIYILAVFGGIAYATIKLGGVNSSLITNAAWGILYVILFLPFIRAGLSDKVSRKLSLKENLPTERLVYE